MSDLDYFMMLLGALTGLGFAGYAWYKSWKVDKELRKSEDANRRVTEDLEGRDAE